MRETALKLQLGIAGEYREVRVKTAVDGNRIRLMDYVSGKEFGSFTSYSPSVVDPRNREAIKRLVEIYMIFRDNKIQEVRDQQAKLGV